VRPGLARAPSYNVIVEITAQAKSVVAQNGSRDEIHVPGATTSGLMRPSCTDAAGEIGHGVDAITVNEEIGSIVSEAPVAITFFGHRRAANALRGWTRVLPKIRDMDCSLQ